MFVINRRGMKVELSIPEIESKINKFSLGLHVNDKELTTQVVQALYPSITTSEIDRMTCKLAYARNSIHKDYGTLASRLYVDNIHRMTTSKFSEACTFAQNRVDMNGHIVPILDAKYYAWIMKHAKELDAMIQHERDYLFSYAALCMAEDIYLTSLKFSKSKPFSVPVEAQEILSKIPEGQRSTAINRILEDRKDEHFTPFYGYERENGSILIDRVQYALMRVSIQCWYDAPSLAVSDDPDLSGDLLDAARLTKIQYCYDLYSQLYFTHPTPAILNSGRTICQLFSCFILDVPDDLDGIFNSLREVANISKRAGGIAVNISDIRSSKMLIRSTNGLSSEPFQALKLFNDTAEYVNQGGSRQGALACYIGLEHPEVRSILQYRDPSQGEMKKKTLHLFYSVWGNNLFFKRLKDHMENGTKQLWRYFDPDISPGLSSLHGEEYEKLYLSLEAAGCYVGEVEVQELFGQIVKCLFNTGLPYVNNKDPVNFKSNHQGRGTIKASNLCCEINEYFDVDNPACCVLASVCLDRFTKPVSEKDLTGNLLKFIPPFYANGGVMTQARQFFSQYFDFDKLAEVTQLLVHNLNQCIMKNSYPLEKLARANIEFKPLAIGVQGLSKCFAKIRIPFMSKEGKLLNKLIFETMYYAALQASVDDVKVYGPYKDFDKSPLGQGLLQFDMWQSEYIFKGPMDDEPRVHKNTNPNHETYAFDKSELTLDWQSLRQRIQREKCCNSLLTSMMPTQSTSMFMNNCDSEAFEPFNGFALQKKMLNGSIDIYNETLYSDLLALGLWSDDLFQKIKENLGLLDEKLNESVGGIIPSWLIELYRGVWDKGMTKAMIEMSRDRGVFVDQSQSLNLYFREDDNTYERIYRALMYCWKNDLKTMSYYIRSRLDPSTNMKTKPKKESTAAVVIEEEGAEVCRLIRNSAGEVIGKSCCSG